MVGPLLAIANFLLPQSTASSRPLLALNALLPRLFLSLASFQTDMSRVHSSAGKRKAKGKGKAAIGDDHALFEHSDWLHIAQRKSSSPHLRPVPRRHQFLSSIQTAPFTALAAFGPRATVHTPLRLAPSLSPPPQSTVHPASGKAKVYGISPAEHR